MADSAHITCPSCFRSLTPAEVGFLLEEGVLVDGCETEITMDNVFINPSPDTRRFASPAEVFAARWYHVTHREDWHGDVTAGDGVFVHIGTEAAALDRFLGFLNNAGDEPLEPVYIYELSLTEDARLERAIALDENDDYGDLNPREQAHDVQRYLNRWESPGSISLVVSPFKLRVHSRRVVLPEEAYAADSIYNADTSAIYAAMENGED